ncbi:MAG: ice-binding family protein [Spirochaetia bacterium]
MRTAVVASAPNLGTAASFAVFGGGAGITNQGTATAITGNMGTTGASTMITGFHSSVFSYAETPLNIGSVSGTVYTNAPEGTVSDFVYANAAAADALTAFNDLASRPDGTDPGAGQLGGLTLLPGVYKSASGAFLITGSDLTLDAQGNPDAVWIFQMASSLTVGTPLASSSVILVNGAKASNVYWQVGSAATINGAGGGSMAGTIIASAGMTFSTAGNATVTTLNGRALGLFAAVTMVNAVINVNGTAVAVVPPVVVPSITVTGSAAANVVPVAGNGFINVQNNGGVVTATEVGTGTIAIVNNGGVLTATNTGNGLMTINSDATGAVTVTNTGNGRITVNATGAAAVTITHTGDEDVTY